MCRKIPPHGKSLLCQGLIDLPVLIVDGNATSRHLLQRMLADWGMKATSVDRGPSALAELERTRAMGSPFPLSPARCRNVPEMDGYAIAEKIKNNPRFKPTEVVMLTSMGFRGDAAKCREIGIRHI